MSKKKNGKGNGRGNGNNRPQQNKQSEKQVVPAVVKVVTNEIKTIDQEITMSKLNTTELIEAANSERTSNKETKKEIKTLNGKLKDITSAIATQCKGITSSAKRSDIAAEFQDDISKVNHRLEELTTKDNKFDADAMQAMSMVAGDAVGAVLESPVRGAIGFFGAMKSRCTGKNS